MPAFSFADFEVIHCYKRDQRKNEKDILYVMLAHWEICDETVQNVWNDIENVN